jgi:L-iditol 2-dehydrogenase
MLRESRLRCELFPTLIAARHVGQDSWDLWLSIFRAFAYISRALQGNQVKSAILTSGPKGGSLRVEVVDMETPVPGPGELVVEMKACGLCGTDLEKIRGEYTASMAVIGHEAVGKISSVGPGVAGFKIGDHVFPHHHVPCYECYLCRAGEETMCDRYRSSNIVPGGFSESFRVPEWNVKKGGVLKLPSALSFEVASLIEPIACCVRAVERCKVESGNSVLIAGAGPVGMMNAILLKERGAKVIVSDVSEARLDFAEKAGIGMVLNAAEGRVPDQVRSETDGRGADLAIIASGSKNAILQGLRSIRKGGQVCLFGIPTKGSVLDYDVSELYNSDQRIITSYSATEKDTKEALQILSGNADDFGRLITHRFPLDRFDEATEAASDGTAMKVVVTP